MAGAACSSGSASALSEGASPAPGGAQVCRAADLKAMFRGFQGAGGALAGAVVVTDAGASPCWLSGTPQSVTLLDDTGGSVSVKSHATAVPVDAGAVLLAPGTPMPQFGEPPAKGATWFVVTWSNWCADSGPTITSLLVVLPAGGSVSAPLDTSLPGWAITRTSPRCDDTRAGSTLSIGRFQAPGAQSASGS